MKMLLIVLVAAVLGGDVATLPPRVEPPAVPATAESGFAPHYSPRLMAKVARRRKLDPAPCMVSRPRGPIGGWVYVYGERTGQTLKCLITDVSHPRDLKRHLRTRRIVELSWETTAQICGTTKGRPVDCPVRVWEAT
jgi:hypothetical protein